MSLHDKPGPEASATGAELAERYRPEFPILRSKVYLNSNSLGALGRRSLRERRRFEREWMELGASAWYELWLDRLDEVRAAFGRTVGATADRIALVPSISAGLTMVADTLDFERRPRVVTCELDFPTLLYQFLGRRERGVETLVLESPDGLEVPLEAWEEAIDDRTALVATSHVFFTSGAIQDVAALARLAHERGALFLVDAYQSNGQIPIDAPALDVDFLLSGGLKWLLGGPGIAYLYVRPGLAERLAAGPLSWFGVREPFAFDPRAADARPDARRFELGTPAAGAAFTAAGGLEVIEEIGVEAIRPRNAALAEDLLERLREAGFEPHVAPARERRSAIVLVHHPRPAAAVEHLARAGIIVDHRPGLVRFSPHFYNTIEDNMRAVQRLISLPGVS
jgi:selenocysteine lyase/cysteine desulfurase